MGERKGWEKKGRGDIGHCRKRVVCLLTDEGDERDDASISSTQWGEKREKGALSGCLKGKKELTAFTSPPEGKERDGGKKGAYLGDAAKKGSHDRRLPAVLCRKDADEQDGCPADGQKRKRRKEII